MPLGPWYTWFMQTKSFEKISFYSTPHQYKAGAMEPFAVEPLDQGSCYEIDATGNDDLHAVYRVSPDDNSFVLVPFDQVIRIWSEQRDPPMRVKMKHMMLAP